MFEALFMRSDKKLNSIDIGLLATVLVQTDMSFLQNAVARLLLKAAHVNLEWMIDCVKQSRNMVRKRSEKGGRGGAGDGTTKQHHPSRLSFQLFISFIHPSQHLNSKRDLCLITTLTAEIEKSGVIVFSRIRLCKEIMSAVLSQQHKNLT